MSDNTETPAATLDAATRKDELPLEGLTLVGTFIGPDSARALLRHSDGRIEQVSPGDRVGWRKVAAIEEGVLMLAHKGETARLTLVGAT